MKVILILFAAFSLFSVQAKTKTKLPDFKKLIIEYPEGDGPFPTLILAPGLKYHMRAPIIEGLAKQSLKKGIAVIRFDWKNKKTDNKSLQNKMLQLNKIFAHTKNLKKIDSKNISLAGKSWGSIVAYNYFRRNALLKSLVILNPICTWHWSANGQKTNSHSVAEKYYPDLYEESRPVHVIMGNKDKLCKLNTIYDYLKVTDGNVSINVFAGGQNLTLGPWSNPKYYRSNAHNIIKALEATAHWLTIGL